MNENTEKQNNLIDTTDCLEAVAVLRCWKNFLFIIVILCLLLLQCSFWAVNIGLVKTDDTTATPAFAAAEDSNAPLAVTTQLTGEQDEIAQAAKKVTADAEAQPKVATAESSKLDIFLKKFESKHIAWLIRFVNFVLVIAAVLYCLTILFSLKISLLARLGGISHLARAFFLSLLALVLLLPWQIFFDGVVAGVMYTSKELFVRAATEGRGIFGDIFYYLRFTGYWLLVLLILILSQVRSFRWSRTVLRRLEII